MILFQEIGYPDKKPSSAVAVNPRRIEQHPDAISNANDVSSSPTTSIMKKNSTMNNREQSKPKECSQILKENEPSLITEPTSRPSTRNMKLRSCNIYRDPSSPNTRKAAEMAQSMDKLDAAATLIDLSEANNNDDQKEDNEDLLLSEALLNEETKRNKSLSAAKEELVEAIQRHQLYVNHFIGPENSTALKLGKSQRERRSI